MSLSNVSLPFLFYTIYYLVYTVKYYAVRYYYDIPESI